MPRPPFHLAFPVADLERTRAFYEGLLGCRVGRSAERWMDFDFEGHRISAHVVDDAAAALGPTNPVDDEDVPVRHFGLVLDWKSWENLAERLREAGAEFLIAPTVRFEGLPGEQACLFLRDPSGNALEFKAFRRPEEMFQPQG